MNNIYKFFMKGGEDKGYIDPKTGYVDPKGGFPSLSATNSELIHKDIMGNTNIVLNLLKDVFESEIDDINTLVDANKVTGAMKTIFSGLIRLSSLIDEQQLADLAIAILVDDRVSDEVAKIMSKNLAKSGKMFLQEFNAGIEEEKEQLIHMAAELSEAMIRSAGSGVAGGLSDAISDFPPIGAAMAVTSLAKGGLEAIDNAITKTEVLQNTIMDTVNKAASTIHENVEKSGIPEVLSTVESIQKIDPEAMIQKAETGTLDRVNSKIAEQKSKIPDVKVSKPDVKVNTGIQSKEFTGGNLKSILKTHKKQKSSKKSKTRKVRFYSPLNFYSKKTYL